MSEKVKICVATKARGIFKETFSDDKIKADFNLESPLYNVNGSNNFIKNIARGVFLSNIGDVLGLFQRISIKNKECDYYWSYNRFLNCDKPYILYVEHPIALQHYRISRNKYIIGRSRINKCLNDDNLKAIVFQAKFSEKTFEQLIGKYNGIIKQIYPIVPSNKYITGDKIIERCHRKEFRVLFSAQASRFVSKSAPELLIAYRKLKNNGYSNIKLNILTQIKQIDNIYINENKDVNWIDYNLSRDEMEKLYSDSTVLVLVSSDDSLNAVAVESLKAGLPIISSNMSGFPEIVEEGKNGFMTKPKWYFFDQNDYPNPEVWNNRKHTLYSRDISERIVEFIYDKLKELYLDREKLADMAIYSLKKGTTGPFSRECIENQWNELLTELEGITSKSEKDAGAIL